MIIIYVGCSLFKIRWHYILVKEAVSITTLRRKVKIGS